MKISLIAALIILMLPVMGQIPPADQTLESNCDRTYDPWVNKYRKLETYIPTPDDPVIVIHCNILIWQDDQGKTNFQDTPEHRERLYNLFHHPAFGLNFQMYERYNAPSDPVIPPEQEIQTKNIYFQLDGIYFFQSSKQSASSGMHDKRKYLRENGFGYLLNQLNVNITTSPGPVKGAWGHAEHPSYNNQIPMVTTTDDPNQRGYEGTPTKEDSGFPVSMATFDGVEYYRDWSFMEHIAHELGHCLDLKHVYDGKVGMGYEACDTTAADYMDDLFPVTSKWCGQPPRNCDVCLQQSSGTPPDQYPDDGMTNNLMNGKGGRYLSPKQLGKIHRAFATKSIGLACSGYSPVPIEIEQDETWDFTMQLYRPLKIKAGATLTISCELRMPAEGRIIIEPGGKLIIDGGTIKVSNPNAGSKWRGVKVKQARKNPEAISYGVNGGTIQDL